MAKHITNKYIRNFFKITQEEADAVLAKLERVVFQNAEEIVTAGEEADAMYFIDDGKVDVLNAEGDTVNEMAEGQYFGEYGVIAEEPRMTTCVARGKVVCYRLSKEALLEEISKKPTIMGYLLKNVYGQLSLKHSKLLQMARARRGIIQPPVKRSRSEKKTLIITYSVILVLFVLVGVFCPEKEDRNPLWMAIPAVFFLVHNIVTRRTLETFILSIALTCGIANGGNFFRGLFDSLNEGLSMPDTAATVLIMALMGAVTGLLDGAGGISAFRRPAEKGVKSGRAAMFAMLGLLALIFIDDYLNLLAASFCLVGVMDKYKIPREKPALLGTSATAICSLIPLSVWGAFLSGTITMTVGETGGAVFLASIKYNFASIAALIGCLLLCLGKLPKTKEMKDAEARVKEGGTLWPEGSEKYFLASDDHEIYGSRRDLIVPLITLTVASVATGTARAGGSFGLDAGTGLFVTLVVMFFLYCGEKLMTPEQFLDRAITGVQNSVLPIILLVLTVCFSNGLLELNFRGWAETAIPNLLGSALWLLPAVLYVAFALLTVLLGSSWGMYGIGIPVAAHLALALGMNLPLAIGAICAAGITGEVLMPYLAEGSLLASAIGCSPYTVRKLRFRYWGAIAVIAVIGYAIAGYCLF